jgi:EmrB/QacA subfamily drug resistance transporter
MNKPTTDSSPHSSASRAAGGGPAVAGASQAVDAGTGTGAGAGAAANPATGAGQAADTGHRVVFSKTEVRSIFIAVMLSVLMVALDQTIVSVALPVMSSQLAGFDLLAWVVSGYLIAVAVTTPIYGKLGDLYGRRIMLLVAIGIFLAASVLCALAVSMPMLVAGRILQGVGGGGLFALSQAVIAEVVTPRERGRYQGYFSATYAIASVAGPLLGGMLTHYLSWHYIFWINLPLGLAALLISRRALARLPVPNVRRPVDYAGALLLACGLCALLVAVTHVGQGQDWDAPVNLGLAGAAAVLLAGFVWWQQRAVEPLLPLFLLRIRTVSISCFLLFIAFFQVVSLSVLIPLRTQMLTGSTPDLAALQLIPLTLAVPLGAFVGGGLLSRTGRTRPSQLAGAALVPFGLLGIALLDPQQVVPGSLVMIFTGLGIGLQFPTSLVAIQNAVPRQHMGVATSSAAFSRSLGAALGMAVLTAILLETLRRNAPGAASALNGADVMGEMLGARLAQMTPAALSELSAVVLAAFRRIFLFSAAASAAALALAWLLPDRRLGGADANAGKQT